MSAFHQRLIGHLRFRAAAYLVFLIALVPAGIAYWRVQKNVRARDEARFNAITAKTTETIREQLELLTADLLAVRGFFEVNSNVTRSDWDEYIARLDLDRRHPGIRSVGFAEKIRAEGAAALTERMRKVEPDFEIRPRIELPLGFPTVHVMQYATNVSKRGGWDSYSVPARRAALDAVMETSEPSVTMRMIFGGKDSLESRGVTIFVPVRAKINGAENENGSIRGVVFSSVTPQLMFNTLSNRQFQTEVSVELFDGSGARNSSTLLAAAGSVSDKAPQPAFTQSTPIRFLNHTFVVRMATLPEFEMYSEKDLPRAVLAGALALSFLLAGITWLQGSARAATEKLNRRLRESEEQLRASNAELERKMAEAKRTEELLAYERDLLGMLLDHSPDAVYFKDRDSRFIKCGRAVHGHLGLNSGEEAVGKTDFDFFTETHARPAFEIEREIIRTGAPVIGLVEKETWKDGHETWVLTSKMPLRDKQGNTIGTFGISKDITKLKAIELALEKEKELLAVTLRSIGDGVITADVHGRIVLLNQVAERLTGWTQADAQGRPLKEVFCMRGDESDTELLRRTLDESAPLFSRAGTLVPRDGLERNIEHSLAPIIDHDGQRIGAVLVFRDITEKLKTEAELVKASKLESIGVLAGGIAHDFNNILTVILGNISLARIAVSMGQPINDALAEAENASLRARELTQRLLTFAKGGAPIKKPLDLSALIRECAVRALHESDVELEFFLGEELWMVEADETQIGHAVQNLLTYARASMSEDLRLDIHVLNQEVAEDPLLFLKPGRYVRVSIRDYGTGIQPENLAKIFEPYFGGKKQGNGLELATSYSIVRKHDGQIRVESIAGQGTVFHVYLPAVAGSSSDETGAKGEFLRATQNLPHRVLVMDDELPIRKLAAQLLQRIGCTVATAADGAEAIRLYEAARERGEPFEAVIMDLTVPHGLGGKETIRQLKALDPQVRAIVSSGYSNDPVMANFREFGFCGVVPKPYNTEELTTALGELISDAGERETNPLGPD